MPSKTPQSSLAFPPLAYFLPCARCSSFFVPTRNCERCPPCRLPNRGGRLDGFGHCFTNINKQISEITLEWWRPPPHHVEFDFRRSWNTPSTSWGPAAKRRSSSSASRTGSASSQSGSQVRKGVDGRGGGDGGSCGAGVEEGVQGGRAVKRGARVGEGSHISPQTGPHWKRRNTHPGHQLLPYQTPNLGT